MQLPAIQSVSFLQSSPASHDDEQNDESAPGNLQHLNPMQSDGSSHWRTVSPGQPVPGMIEPHTPPPSTESKQHALSPPVAHVEGPHETKPGSDTRTGRASAAASDDIETVPLHP
jgi:hypothetical protein